MPGAGETELTVHRFRESYFPYVGDEIKDAFEPLKNLRPDLIFTHRRDDEHQDHRTIGQLTWNSFRDHAIAEYEIPKYEGDLGHPNLYVPLAESVAERKVDLLMEHFGSQRSKSWFRPATFRGTHEPSSDRVQRARWLCRGVSRPQVGAVTGSARSVERDARTTVALFGLFGVTNIGNEASLSSALQFLERCPEAPKVVVVCARPEVVAHQHGVEAVPISMAGRMPTLGSAPRLVRLGLRPILELARWWSAYRFMKRVDAIVIPGTGILDDFGVRPHEMPYDIFRWSVAARLAGRPMSMLSVGAGPIDNPLSRWFMRTAVRAAGVVTYRDDISREFMTALGIAVHSDSVQPDLAFALHALLSIALRQAARSELALG